MPAMLRMSCILLFFICMSSQPVEFPCRRPHVPSWHLSPIWMEAAPSHYVQCDAQTVGRGGISPATL